jgi:polysaccharide export outer membrane protein
VLALLTGCATHQPHIDQALLSSPGGAVRNEQVGQQYALRWPDVLDVRLLTSPAWSGQCPIDLDGRIDLGPFGKLRVEGLALSDATRELAALVGIAPSSVQLGVAAYRSQHIYLSGDGNGMPRALAYQGPETVLDLLQRAGGVQPGAAPRDVYLIRAGVAEGQPPQYFHIDLQAIVLKQDQRTNLRVQPFDQIYVGETKQSSLQKCFPPWLQPLYQSLFGLRRPGASSSEPGPPGNGEVPPAPSRTRLG